MNTQIESSDGTATGIRADFAAELAEWVEVMPGWCSITYRALINPQQVTVDVTDFWRSGDGLPTGGEGIKDEIPFDFTLAGLREDADDRGNARWLATYKVTQA